MQGAEYADDGWPETEIMPTDPTSKETKVLRAAGEAAKGCDAVVIVLGTLSSSLFLWTIIFP